MRINRVYFWNYFQRLVNSLGGVLLVLVISISYSVESAGEFYSVYSLIGGVAIFEFGYSVLILQRMSKYSGTNLAVYDERISSDLKHYLSVIKLFVITFLTIFPLISISITDDIVDNNIVIIGCMTLLLSLNIMLSMLGNILEGLGYIEKIAKVRTVQSFFTYGTLLASLLLHLGVLSILIQLCFQVGVFAILITRMGLDELKENISIMTMFGVPRLSDVNFNKIKFDFKYSSQLYLTFLSAFFCNQVWIIAITVSGNNENISKVAMMLQIITAAAGFALTPIASRLAEVAGYHVKKTHNELYVLIKKITKDVVIVSAITLLSVFVFYSMGRFFYMEKVVSINAAYFFVFSLPLIIVTNLIGIIIQSKGHKDIIWVSVFRILTPSISFLFLDSNTTDTRISIYYFTTNLIAFVIVMVYMVKELKWEK